MSGVLCDRKVKVKGKLYRTVVYWAKTSKSHEKKLEVAEIRRMLRWMCGVTKLDRNERIRGTTKVGQMK